MTFTRMPPSSDLRQAQRGVVLLISLIMLVAMSLAGIVLFRQVASGVMIAGNLAMRSATVAASDRGVEAARAFLVNPATSLLTEGAGYFPAWCLTRIGTTGSFTGTTTCETPTISAQAQYQFSPQTFDWAGQSQLVTADDGAKNEIRYVIHRLCAAPTSLSSANQQCVTLKKTVSSGKEGGEEKLSTSLQPYFRATIRAAGQRNTVVYTQVLIY